MEPWIEYHVPDRVAYLWSLNFWPIGNNIERELRKEWYKKLRISYKKKADGQFSNVV